MCDDGLVIADARAKLLADTDLRGREWCVAWCAAVDTWLAGLYDQVMSDAKGEAAGLCLMAVGGYGRGILAPHSDLDIVLVHAGRRQPSDELLRQLWYPIWDAGFKVGHAVRPTNWKAGANDDQLDTVTGLLCARPLAGDPEIGMTLRDHTVRSWRKHREPWLKVLRTRTEARHLANGEAAFMLEPDLKQGRGGLRDAATVGWLEAADLRFHPDDRAAVDAAENVLLDVRVGLHRVTQRAEEILRLDDQDAVAEVAGFTTATAMMTQLASVARNLDWVLSARWAFHDRRSVGSWPAARPVASGIVIDQGEVHLAPSVCIADDPALVFRLAVVSARNQIPIARPTLDRLAAEVEPLTGPWPAGAVDEFVAFLLEGERAIPVWEALDHANLIVRLLPEWGPVRARPQRNVYHRYTVDRHSWEAVAEASKLADRVHRADLLVLGALFHDLGKGYSGDHSVVGVGLVEAIGPRLGLSNEDTEVLATLVRHHLLLPDVATRRDLADPATLAGVADAVGDLTTLQLLATLTQADSLATGHTAWSPWKAELMADLVDRVGHVLGGGSVEEVTWRLFPTGDVLARMGAGEMWVGFDGEQLVAVSPDLPGTLSRVAGALALHDLDVLSAQAHSDEQGMAASAFRFTVPARGIDREAVVLDVERALSAQLAISSRLAERARTYRRRRRQSATKPITAIVFDHRASHNATVIEVRAPDTLGLLHRLTNALAELGLDVRHATVQTLGQQAIDTFYVRTRGGSKLLEELHRAEVERALVHAVGSSS
ncbi:MAG: glnD [Ilumatobacteraceae bacterium]|nr:glnD [Ilumatobacteraceae bacterium]